LDEAFFNGQPHTYELVHVYFVCKHMTLTRYSAFLLSDLSLEKLHSAWSTAI